MRSVYIVIILIAFLGILINGQQTYKTSENKVLNYISGQNNPHDFTIPPHQDSPLVDDVNSLSITDKYDVLGNKIVQSSNNGLNPGKLLHELNGKNHGVPTTRISDFASASALTAKEPLMTAMPLEEAVNVSNRMGGLPTDVFPQFEKGALIPLTSKDKIEGVGPLRETKAVPFLGGVYEQQHEIKEKDENFDTGLHNVLKIIKPGVQRNTKTLSFFETVDRYQGETAAKRSEANINHVFDNKIEVSDKPDITSVIGERDLDLISEKENLSREEYLRNLRDVGRNTTESIIKRKM